MEENKKPENPNAFAFANQQDIQYGMTLRDYFASKAMQTPVNNRPSSFYQWIKWFFGCSFEACTRPHYQNAIQAYELADAMLKQREL